MDGNTYLASRAWILMLLEGAERNGISPVPMEQLHRYIYLANVLSPVCNLIMPESYTLKHMRGPYFPRAQWDIGRLIIQDYIESKKFRPFSDDDGFWLAADFRITQNGILFVRRLTELDYFKEQANYLREFMSACSLIPKSKINYITQLDFHYAAASDGEGVRFSELEGNISKEAAVLMFPKDRVFTPTEGVHRYINYLDEVSVNS
jgi:hypothetical protein|tara:strand:- start:1788 stop:2405 length:618 start_codon:yes stop_codon:yes gene_type:complete